MLEGEAEEVFERDGTIAGDLIPARAQREGELLEHAADQAVRAVEQDLAAMRKQLSGALCSPGDVFEDAVCVVIAVDQFHAVPHGRLPYYPVAAQLREPLSEHFRKLEAMARPNDALEAYTRLGRITSVAINGEPTDLLARRAPCSLLNEQSRMQELRQEAGTLADELHSGKWQPDPGDVSVCRGTDWAWPCGNALEGNTFRRRDLAGADGAG